MKADARIEWQPEEIEENLENYREIIEKGMKEGLRQAIRTTEEGGREVLGERAATVGNERIQQSLSTGDRHNISKVVSHQTAEVGTNYPGVNLIKEGTRPHMPPWTPIQEWVEKNTGALNVTDIGRATYYFRKHISEHGTEATHFLTEGLAIKRDDVQKAINEAAEKIIKELGLE